MTKRVVPSASPRKVRLEPGSNSATSAAPARFAEPRLEPEAVFEPMRVPRMQVRKLREADLVVDMDTVPLRAPAAAEAASSAVPETPAQPPEAVIVASQARVAARIQRLREVVADLRLEIEAVRRS
ncbi:MAG: hypothetical protein RLZ83_232 [Pseudomonadota bacterium]|jgi:hypothetical protein